MPTASAIFMVAPFHQEPMRSKNRATTRIWAFRQGLIIPDLSQWDATASISMGEDRRVVMDVSCPLVITSSTPLWTRSLSLTEESLLFKKLWMEDGSLENVIVCCVCGESQ